MKAGKTRDTINWMRILLDYHKNGGFEELTELERLAELGKAVENAFEHDTDITICRDNIDGCQTKIEVLTSVYELLDWYHANR